jgi:hypothetical protein
MWPLRSECVAVRVATQLAWVRLLGAAPLLAAFYNIVIIIITMMGVQQSVPSKLKLWKN